MDGHESRIGSADRRRGFTSITVDAAMWATPYRDLFKLAPGPVPMLLFARIALAVGVPLIGFVLAGQAMGGVLAAATAMFVSLCDIGDSRRARLVTMFFGALCFAFGGFVGDRFGRTTFVDEALVLGAAFVAAWVSNAQPGLAAIARFGAAATVVGTGFHVAEPGAALFALGVGALSAIVCAMASWLAGGAAIQPDAMDWRAGLRRALAGADAGPRFALCCALTAAVALFAAGVLGVARPYWAAMTVVMVMRREGLLSRQLVAQYMLGTLTGVAAASLLWHVAPGPWAVAALAIVAAAGARPAMTLNPALGFAAFNVFFMLLIDLALAGTGAPAQMPVTRLYDVGVGCALALGGTLLASGWERAASRRGDASKGRE